MAAGMPAAFLAGGQPQAERMATLSAVRGFRLRVIVSTDLVWSRTCRRTNLNDIHSRCWIGCSQGSGSRGVTIQSPVQMASACRQQ